MAQQFSLQFSLKRTGTGSVKDVARDFEQDKVHKACPGSLTLFVALNPKQFEDLQCGKPVLPDPYSGRFGLRSDQAVAVKRGYEFTNWHPASVSDPPPAASESDPPPPVHPKQFMIMKVLLTAQGYMTLMEENVLVKGDGSNPCLAEKGIFDGGAHWFKAGVPWSTARRSCFSPFASRTICMNEQLCGSRCVC